MQSVVTHPTRPKHASFSWGRVASDCCLGIVALGLMMCIVPHTALTIPFDALWQLVLGSMGLAGNANASSIDQIAYFCGYGLLATSLLAYAMARKRGNMNSTVAGFTDPVALFAALFLFDPVLSIARDLSFVNRWWPFYAFAAFFAVLLCADASRAWRLMQFTLFCIGVQTLYAVAFYALHINQFQGARFGARTGGTFGNPNPLYPLCLLAIPLAFLLGRLPASLEWRWITRAVFGLSVVALLLTFTRGAWLALAAMAVYLVIWGDSPKANRKLWRGAAVTIVGVLLLGVLLVRTHGKLIGAYADSSFWGRIYIWQVAARAAADKPVLGSGVSTYAMQQRRFMTPRLEKFRPANIEAKSLYLNVAAESGIVGLALMLWSAWQFFLLKKRCQAQQNPRVAAILNGLCAALLALGVAGVVDTPLLNSDRVPATLALAIMLAIGCILTNAPTATRATTSEGVAEQEIAPHNAGDMSAFADCARANRVLQAALNDVDALLSAHNITYWVIGSCARLATMNRPARRVSDVDIIVPDKRALQSVARELSKLGERHGLFVDASLSRVFRLTDEGYALNYGPLFYPIPAALMQMRRVHWGEAQFSTLPPQTLLHTFGLVAEPLRAQDRKSAREFARFLKGHREFDGHQFAAFHAFWRAHWRYFPLKPVQYWWRGRIKAMPRNSRLFLLRRVYPLPPVRAIRALLTFLETRVCLAPRDAPERRQQMQCDPAPTSAATRRRNSGFSLPEILIVLVVISLLAALLLPAFSRARQRAHQTTCASTLKQFGLAFTMYAQDFDGRLPNPGGRGMQAGGGRTAVTAGENGAVWCAYGAGKGLFAYLKRQTDESNNHWSCPNSLPFAPNWEDTQYNVGQTYSMNDYLRAQYPGQSVAAQGDVPGAFNPGFHTGIRLDEIASASQIILLFEGVEHPRGGAKRNGSPYFGVYPSRYGVGDLPRNVPEEYHFGKSNFLFCDGHVKALNPTQTWTTATQVKVEKLNYNYAHARGGRVGTGSLDLWNPVSSQVVYP